MYRVRPRAVAACRRDRASLAREHVRLDGLGHAGHDTRTERRCHDVTLGEPHDVARHKDGARCRHLLHPRGEMRRLPHRRVVHAQVAADRAHDHLARVEADADLGARSVAAPRGIGVAGDARLHPERGVTGADGVILLGERSPEERHDPVAHHLVHGALVPMNGFHHELQHRIEDGPGLLGIAIGKELHRTLHVGEEDGDLLALALERGARGEDLLGEVPRCVGVGDGKARLCGRRRNQRLCCRRRRGGPAGDRLPAVGTEARPR